MEKQKLLMEIVDLVNQYPTLTKNALKNYTIKTIKSYAIRGQRLFFMQKTPFNFNYDGIAFNAKEDDISETISFLKEEGFSVKEDFNVQYRGDMYEISW